MDTLFLCFVTRHLSSTLGTSGLSDYFYLNFSRECRTGRLLVETVCHLLYKMFRFIHLVPFST